MSDPGTPLRRFWPARFQLQPRMSSVPKPRRSGAFSWAASSFSSCVWSQTVAQFNNLLILSLCCVGSAMARDNGQFNTAPDNVRKWFNEQVSPESGRSCCSIADGHETQEKIVNGQYWVTVNGKWYPVPPSRVIYKTGNPVGYPVVWYTQFTETTDAPDTADDNSLFFNVQGEPNILCFVPGGGF